MKTSFLFTISICIFQKNSFCFNLLIEMRMTDEFNTYVVFLKCRDWFFSFKLFLTSIVSKSSIRRSSFEINTYSYTEMISLIKRVLSYVKWLEHLESYMILRRRRFSNTEFVKMMTFSKTTELFLTLESFAVKILSRLRSSRLSSQSLSHFR